MGMNWNATDLLDDEFFLKTAAVWRRRFAQKREEFHLTQEAFMNLLNESLGSNERKDAPHYGQGAVSNWQNIGTKKKGDEAPIRKTLFPRYEILLHIARVLGVSVGYLMGETDGENFDEEKVSRYLGLSAKTVRAVRELLDGALDLSNGEEDGALGLILNTPTFRDLLQSFRDIEAILSSESGEDPFRRDHRALLKKYGPKTIQKACLLLKEGREPAEADLELADALQELRHMMEREARYSDLRYLQYETARHEALRAFDELLDELFPEPAYEINLLAFLQKIERLQVDGG